MERTCFTSHILLALFSPSRKAQVQQSKLRTTSGIPHGLLWALVSRIDSSLGRKR